MMAVVVSKSLNGAISIRSCIALGIPPVLASAWGNSSAADGVKLIKA